MGTKYFEDYAVGDRYTTLSRTITETDVINFVCSSGMYEELFLSDEYIKKESVFKSRPVPGALTFAIAEGLYIQLGYLHRSAVGFLGLDELKVLAPLYCGETINCEVEVLKKRETKNPTRGIVTARHMVKNHKGENVLQYIVNRMIKRKA